jgi:hypothetical protein
MRQVFEISRDIWNDGAGRQDADLVPMLMEMIIENKSDGKNRKYARMFLDKSSRYDSTKSSSLKEELKQSLDPQLPET